MTTFNTYDYDFLSKCMVDGSLVFKAQSIKRLTNLAVNDKKQFFPNSKQILNNLQQLLIQQRQDINILATILLSQIVINIVSKDNEFLIRNKHLRYVVQNLGNGSKPAIRKVSHTCLLAYIKTYHNFDNLTNVYLTAGFQNQSDLIKQKSINSFQSILLLQMKFFAWDSQDSRKIFENLLANLANQNPYISKASAQCLLSMCKIQGIKKLCLNLSYTYLAKLKTFIEDTLAKLPSTQTQILVKDIDEIMSSMKRPAKQPGDNKKKIGQDQESIAMKTINNVNDANQRRLQKIKKSLANQEKRANTINHDHYNGKMFGNINIDGTLKERSQASQELLYKIQLNKSKPQFQSSVKHILPNVIKMLKDPNPKIVGVSLKILENIIQQTKNSDFANINSLVSVIVQKLGDQKISIRQMVSKVIKELVKKTDKGIWIRELLDNLRRNTNTFLKDQTLTLIHHIYQEYSSSDIGYSRNGLLQQIVVFTQDPKTKIKIRTLDCLSQIAFKTEVQQCNAYLRGKMTEVFYQMYVEKVNRLIHEHEKKLALEQQKNRKKLLQEQTSYKTSYNQRGGHLVRRQVQRSGDNQLQQLNISMDVVRKRVSHLKKSGNVLSTQDSGSLETTHRTIQKNMEDVQLMLPSLYKKTKTNRFTMKKTEFSPMKTIQHKTSSEYLTKEQLKPLKDPQRQFKTILINLKQSDWKTQFETINKLRRLIEFNPQIILTISNPNMHVIILDLLGLIECLRSSVAKNALICLNQLILVMNRQIDPEMQIVMQKLMKKSADTNIFISSEVQKCLVSLATRATQSKIIQKLLAYKQSKNYAIKDATLSTLIAMKEDQRIRQKQVAKITQCFSLFLTEGQQDLRTRSKVAIIQICKTLGDWYRVLRGKMNPLCFKSVCELMTKTNGREQYDLGSHSNLKQVRIKSESKTITTDQTKSASRNISAIRQDRPRAKFTKIAQFPQQFSDIQSWLDESNSSDWKKRIDSLNKIKKVALSFPNQFCQYRSGSHFIDIMSKQMLQPNIKVSLNALQTFLYIIQPLKLLIENHVSVVATSIFNSISSSRIEVKDQAERCMDSLLDNIEVTALLQHITHGMLYALPKSRIFLVNKMTSLVQGIYHQRKQLLFKHVFPTLNKLMDQYKTDLMPHVINLFIQLQNVMGNNMFSHLTKFKQVRQLIAK